MTAARTAIVGTGRVAQAIGRLLADAGSPPRVVAGRTAAHAERAASFIAPAVRATSIADVAAQADHILIAVTDTAIAPVADELARGGLTSGVVLHMSGAHGPQALGTLAARGVSCGVLHPLQTIADPSRGVAALRGASFAVGGDAPAIAWAEQLVAAASGTPLRIQPHRFASYHAGAVMASNAVIAAIDAAVVLLGEAGVDEREALRAIGPLCLTSTRNALELGPAAALTGPVQRGDAETVRAHVGALAHVPAYVGELYRASGRALLHLARRRGLQPEPALAIEQALDGRT
jgi:predicted short-subunit dehydrogenase-like oxidoreductase (DUF2520 family)